MESALDHWNQKWCLDLKQETSDLGHLFKRLLSMISTDLRKSRLFWKLHAFL